MLPVSWSAESFADLEQILGYIAERNPAAADRLLAISAETAERLSEHPYLYRPGRVAGTREGVIHPNYIIVYRVGPSVIDIMSVLHARQAYPPG
ncbi:type II toxin-antitoxin system RelE/ParE family toxin [Mycobacterium sp. KBS0706]|uniref:type II toxin-antitoxin system RelE/ParE family toxin n=1 Tax=Mycobacterium sp. KBS0706 TaxID=2578109 RepID=UPI00110FD121|nr:type II toxin-antitoxin system RelE/ParE family toxin [Mycobacterium sp. KBS0706]TSD86323.1 type II toxin-antitoxin system RelE/ParE family toxin [Mycobacterium sp. KBS0706]